MKLLGQTLKGSSDIEKLIQQLVQAVSQVNQSLHQVQPPHGEFAPRAQEEMQKVGRVRGRPLFYEYLGSGAGRGPFVELQDGSVKLDLINSIGVNILGHSDPRVMAAAIRGALQDVIMQGNLQPNTEYANFSNRMVEIAGRNSRLRHVWLATCGTMANENALKICRQKRTPARKIVAMTNAFAGRSTLMSEITDNPDFKIGLPNYNEVMRLPFYQRADARSTEKTVELFKKYIGENPNNICCLTFEPMQGEGGYRVAPREYFIPLLETAREHKIPVWVDEVQTFMRTGQFFAFETLGFGDYVDVCTVAKTAQNGATFYTEEFNPGPGLIAGTFSGSSASLSAGTEILNILDQEGYMGPSGRVTEIHKEFMAMLNRLSQNSCKGKIQECEGLGLMIGLTPHDGSKDKQGKFLKSLFKNGLIAFGCGHDPYRVRFLIPAVITAKEIELAGDIIEKSILETA